jgi:MFS family permease
MIESFNVPTKNVPFWVGIISASFALSQCLTGVPWGRASDRYGRKPVILLGLISTAIMSVGFGMSHSLVGVFLFRCLSGLGNGNVGIIRTTVAEMVPAKELQPKAFSTIPMMWTIGSIVGPIIGGYLANPVKAFPSVFGDSKLFKTYPYLLPNLVCCCLFVVGISTGVFFLQETLESKKNSPDYGFIVGEKLTSCCRGKRARRYNHRRLKSSIDETDSFLPHDEEGGSSGVGSGTAVPKLRPKPLPFRKILTPLAQRNLYSYTMLAFHTMAFDQLLPVFMHSPPDVPIDTIEGSSWLQFSGGIGMNSQQIGTFFMVYGICGIVIQFTVFPPMAKRFGVLNCLRMCGILFPITYFLTPLTLYFGTPWTQELALFVVLLIKSVAGVFAFPCQMILITNAAASLEGLGTLNGLATSSAALGRAFGPAIVGYIYSLGMSSGWGIMPWWSLSVFACLSCIPIFMLYEGEGPFKNTPTATDFDDDDEEELLAELRSPENNSSEELQQNQRTIQANDIQVEFDDDLHLRSLKTPAVVTREDGRDRTNTQD